MSSDHDPASRRRWELPPLGQNPSSSAEGTTPGSFALRPQIGGPLSFSSPDTPGMPAPSDATAWDFMPRDWNDPKVCKGSNGRWKDVLTESDLELWEENVARQLSPACACWLEHGGPV